MIIIKRLIIENFKCFSNLDLEFNEDINIFIGDNGTGKSTILQALDIVFSGSVKKIQEYNIENIFNKDAVEKALNDATYENLPQISIEVFFEEDTHSPYFAKFRGEKNSIKQEYNGIRFICKPDDTYRTNIEESLNASSPVFPYNFYKSYFISFSDQPYNAYTRPVYATLIDSLYSNTSSVLRKFIKEVYLNSVDEKGRLEIKHKFSEKLKTLELPQTAIDKGICLTGDPEILLDIQQNNVSLFNRGEGEIATVKMKYALSQTNESTSIVLLEEPENRLSCFRLKQIVSEIVDSCSNRQIFITTHSSKIVTGLGIKKAIFIGPNASHTSLSKLADDDSKFFEKATSDNLLQFVLSKKVILVEGAAEYILFDFFYEEIMDKTPESDDVWIIPLNSLSFKRYLNIAKILGIKVAVVRDNDGSNEQRYSDYRCDAIEVFVEENTELCTFEKSLYAENKELCDRIFNKSDAGKHMLRNKADSAYKILCYLLKNKEKFNIPKYIENAILWIGK